MRELFVIALSEDGRSLVLATTPDASRGGFCVAVDDRLVAAVRGQLPARGQDQPRDSPVTPKEIQARLRAGESAQQIAATAGLPVGRIERFSGPVLSERTRMIDSARAAVVVRGRGGPSAVPLGDAVEEHLAATASLRTESVLWSARREDDGRWLVEVTWVARGRGKHGRWWWDPTARAVTAVDPASAALGYLATAPLRPARPQPMVVSEAGPTAPRTDLTPPAATSARAPAGRAAPAKRAGPRAPTRTSPTRTSPRSGPPAAPAQPPAGPGAAAKRKAAAREAAAQEAAAAQEVTADPPQALRAVPASSDDRARTAPRGRASVPAWADVLLGTAARDGAPAPDDGPAQDRSP